MTTFLLETIQTDVKKYVLYALQPPKVCIPRQSATKQHDFSPQKQIKQIVMYGFKYSFYCH